MEAKMAHVVHHHNYITDTSMNATAWIVGTLAMLAMAILIMYAIYGSPDQEAVGSLFSNPTMTPLMW
jgi:hypothetical protein